MKKRTNACDRNRESVIRMAGEGVSFSEIARVVGTNKARVREWVAKNGVHRIPHSQKGAGNGRWRGGRRIDEDGYVLLWMPEHPDCDSHGLIREHRLVMEKKLGRRLLPTEVVHHDPSVAKSDNRPEVLTVFDSNSAHLRHELTGKRPNHTTGGIERMRERGRRLGFLPRKSNQPQSESGDGVLQEMTIHQKT